VPQGPTQCQSRQGELIRVLIYLVYLLIHNSTGLCTPFLHLYVTKCDISSHAINRTENKGKEIEKKIHIDLAVIASQWSKLAVHDKSSGVKRTQ